MTIGENIKRIRKEKGLTQKKLGELSGINEAQIRRYELGGKNANPKIETIQKIADALDVNMFDIFDFETTISMGYDILNKCTTEQSLNIAEKLADIAEEKYKAKYSVDTRLIVAYDELNEQGKEKVVSYAEDISKLPEYRKD